MSLFVAWVVFPLVLAVLAVGCGLLVERVAGLTLPRALLPAVGLTAIVVAGQFTTLLSATAELTTPLVVALAIAGFGLAGVARLRAPGGWPLAAAAAVFAVYAAPIVLSGAATFAGYIRLDDTATWLALTDRIMEHGRSLEGLAPSTYEATLAFNLGDGYPVGVFVPLGVAREVVGQDLAWVIQPYMAFLAVVLALGAWTVTRPLVGSPALRALVAFVAAQPALLFGYYLWGGIKEMAAAALVVNAVALVATAIDERFAPRSLAPPAVACAALIGVLSVGGAIWLLPALALALAFAIRSLGIDTAVARAGGFALLTAALCLPVIIPGGLLPPTSAPLTDAEAQGNLFGPLDPLQVTGIWPAGDFRGAPDDLAATHVLIAVALVGAAIGLAFAWRRRAWAPLIYAAGTLASGFVLVAVGSPWVGGKALATASPLIPFAAALAGSALVARGWRFEGGVLLVAVVGGVLWSNALAYRDVSLAPREQLVELEEIGELVAGQGPALMTEYQPYGARHFLREADPEAASELRRRRVPLRDGEVLAKGLSTDTDELDPDALLDYRTLVLRRSPAQSRPPFPYALRWSGDHYEAWQRPPGSEGAVVDRIGLGDRVSPVGRPSCDRVLELAERAGEDGSLAASSMPPVVVAPLSQASYPDAWQREKGYSPIPRTPGSLRVTASIDAAGVYEVWLGGSIGPRVELFVDGRPGGSARHVLNNSGQYVSLGSVDLPPGRHQLEVRFHGTDRTPGSGGRAAPIGPLVLSRGGAATAGVALVSSTDAEELCGRAWDWIEAIAADGARANHENSIRSSVITYAK